MFFCPRFFLNFKEKRMLSNIPLLSFDLNFNLKKKHLPSAQPKQHFFGGENSHHHNVMQVRNSPFVSSPGNLDHGSRTW